MIKNDLGIGFVPQEFLTGEDKDNVITLPIKRANSDPFNLSNKENQPDIKYCSKGAGAYDTKAVTPCGVVFGIKEVFPC